MGRVGSTASFVLFSRYNFLQLELKTQLIGFYIVSGRQQKILGNGYRSEFLLDLGNSGICLFTLGINY